MKSYSFENIVKSYGSKRVLSGASGMFPSGSMVGLLGLNGSGKSTLLNILGGVDRDFSGDVSYRGNRVSYMRTVNPFSEFWRAREVLGFYNDFYAFDGERARKMLDLAHIDGKARFRSLSAGMQRQLLFIASFCVDADLLLMDEPLTNLDVQYRDVITDALIERAMTDRIIVVATHEIREFENLLTHVAYLKDGRLSALTPAEDIRERGMSIIDFYKERVQ